MKFQEEKLLALKYLSLSNNLENSDIRTIAAKHKEHCVLISDYAQGIAYINRKERKLIIVFSSMCYNLHCFVANVERTHLVPSYSNFNSPVRVNSDILFSYKSIRETLIKFARDKRVAFDTVLVAGHSYGGAVATLCATDMQYNVAMSVTCITSGSPRVGNKHFVKSFNRRIMTSYRFVVRNDTIPMLPSLISGYSHVKGHIKLGALSISDIICKLFNRGVIVTDIKESHYFKHYEEELKK